MMQLIALLFIGIIISLILVRIPLIVSVISNSSISLGAFQVGMLLIWSMFSFAAFVLDK